MLDIKLLEIGYFLSKYGKSNPLDKNSISIHGNLEDSFF